MKKKLFVSFLSLFSIIFYGQDDVSSIIRDYKEKINRIEKKSLKTKYLLNKGFLIEDPIAEFIDFKGSGEDGFKSTNRRTFIQTYRMLRRSDLKTNKRLPNYNFKNQKKTAKNKSDYIPIGLVQAKGELLELDEIEDNISLTEEGIPITTEYSKYHIFNASVLKRKVYSKDVTFEALPDLFFIQNENQVKSISINFDDGEGWKPLSRGDVFQVQYDTNGLKSIAIKFELARREFINYSPIRVVQIEQEEPNMIFELSSNIESSTSNINNVKEKTQLNKSASNTGLSGGTAFLYVGCDGVLDRPVIIVEGFDPLNEVFIEDLRENYIEGTDIEQTFRNNGRDVIYLDFKEGGTDIRTNGNVLRNLIESINREKQGNQSTVVIGESMGGLVARWAIRTMEISGLTHNVSHYISFDSPHLGANVPVGYQTLLEDLDQVDVRDLFGIGQEDIDEAFDMLDSKAARQMLLRHRGPNPHPDFTNWQNELNSIGFPAQGGIQNIAIVNGALNGSTTGDGGLDFSPGARIFELDWINPILSGRVRIRTNTINSNGRVSSLVIFTTVVPSTVLERNFTFDAFNYDITAGGFQDNQGAGDTNLPVWAQILLLTYVDANSDNDNFSFVPLFSGLASNAPINNQNDLNRSEANLRANNWTPFNSIYGNNNDNTPHIRADFLRNAWDDLLETELGLTRRTTCGVDTGSGIPVTPRINTDFWFSCQNSGTTRTIRVDNDAAISNLYEHSWSVTGPQSFSGNGDTMTINSTMRPGVYRINCTRRFRSNQEDQELNGEIARTTSRLFTLFRSNDSRNCGNTGGGTGGGNDRPGGIGIPLKFELGEELEPLNDIVIWPNPVEDEFQVGYYVPQDGKVSLTLYSLTNATQPINLVKNKAKTKGNYFELFSAANLPSGIYVLTIKINGKREKRKLIIERK